MTVEISAARNVDVAAIEALLVRAELPLEGFQQCLPNALVARCAAEVVGVAALELHGEHALLRSVAVNSTHRDQGIGGALVASTLRLATEAGAHHVYLLTTTATHFFATCGFEAISRDQAPPAITSSAEFSRICPQSAVLMHHPAHSADVTRHELT
jgi:amino-acid N-acetyltransferase